MKFVLLSTTALMFLGGSLGIIDFSTSYQNGTLPFLQQEISLSSAKTSVFRERRLMKHDNAVNEKSMDFYFEGFSRGMIDYDEDFIPLALENVTEGE